jgi:hypothetical protein
LASAIVPENKATGIYAESLHEPRPLDTSRFDLGEDALPIGTVALAQVAMDDVQRGG